MRTTFALAAVFALLAPAGASAQATCISNGQAYQVGDIACIPGCHGAQRLARCDAVNQTASWTTIAQNCPTARATPLPPGGPVQTTLLACTFMPTAPLAQIQ